MPAPVPVDEATRRAGVVWLGLPGRAPRLVWHAWHEGALWTVVGGLEQQVPALADGAPVTVTVRGGGAVAAVWSGVVQVVAPTDPAYDGGVAVLHAVRLNAPDGDAQPARWAVGSTVVRVEHVPA